MPLDTLPLTSDATVVCTRTLVMQFFLFPSSATVTQLHVFHITSYTAAGRSCVSRAVGGTAGVAKILDAVNSPCKLGGTNVT